jgi:hypothetical protein
MRVPPSHASITVIWPSVNVPVLSEQMLVAPPIVSHACRWRTKLLSLVIAFMEYAKLMITANGSPCSTAERNQPTTLRTKTAHLGDADHQQRDANDKRVDYRLDEGVLPGVVGDEVGGVDGPIDGENEESGHTRKQAQHTDGYHHRVQIVLQGRVLMTRKQRAQTM